MPDLLHLRRLATLLLLAATVGLAVLGARGFEQKLETFQPLGFQATAAAATRFSKQREKRGKAKVRSVRRRPSRRGRRHQRLSQRLTIVSVVHRMARRFLPLAVVGAVALAPCG